MEHRANLNRDADNLISLPTVVIQQAFERAQNLGIDLSEYILSLITRDLSEPTHRSWFAPLPESVSQQYDQDAQELLTIESQTPQSGATTGQELADLLDQEIEHLANG